VPMNSRTWLVRARSVPLDHGGVRSKHRPMLVATNQRRQRRQLEERTSRSGAAIMSLVTAHGGVNQTRGTLEGVGERSP
jgi:hypothetical protein